MTSRNTDFNRKLGNLGISKGKLDEVPIAMWDAVPLCNEETCPIAESCPYNKTGRCTVRVKYLANVFDAVSNLPENLDPITILKIGMHIIPMYSQLCRFKMEEYNSPTMVADAKGNLKVNPIFREIRETIKVANSLLQDLDSTVNGLPTDGDQEYYDSLFTEPSPTKKPRIKKK